MALFGKSNMAIFVVLGAVALSIALVTIFFPEPYYENEKDLINYALESDQYELAEETYLALIRKDSLNPDYYYGHIYSHFLIPENNPSKYSESGSRRDESILKFYEQKSLSDDGFQKDIGYYGLGICNIYLKNDDLARFYFNNITDRDLKYLNNSLGKIFLRNCQYDSAEVFLLREINNNGNLEGAYSNIMELYLKTGQYDKIGQLLNDGKIGYFSDNDLIEYYFKTGDVANYLKLTLSVGFRNFDLKSFIAAFLIMLVWLFYLRKIDLFQPEKWIYLIITFLLGIIFSYGTFIFSDINNYKIGFSLTGDVGHDLLYCFLGIGLIEETMKLIPFLILLKFSKQVNEPIDYIIYISVSALGFAFAENILYFHGFGLDIIHGRALISVVVHMICSSIIGYGLYFGFNNIRLPRYLRLIVFLLIASFLHGFYDFWLINETVNAFSIVSILLVISGLSVWNSMINNCLNFSVPENLEVKNIVLPKLKDYLIYGLSGILIFEYMIVSFLYGPLIGNQGLANTGLSGAYLIIFLSNNLSSFRVRKYQKQLIKFYRGENDDYQSIVGDYFTLQGIAAIRYDIMPLTGEIVKWKTVEEEEFWYLLKLDTPLSFENVCNSHVMIMIQKQEDMIEKGEKTIVGVFLINKKIVFEDDEITKDELIFCGWAMAY